MMLVVDPDKVRCACGHRHAVECAHWGCRCRTPLIVGPAEVVESAHAKCIEVTPRGWECRWCGGTGTGPTGGEHHRRKCWGRKVEA